MPAYSVIEKGTVSEVTIAQANIAQTLVPNQALVASVIVQPGSVQNGTILVGYCGAPKLQQMALQARPGKWIDLSLIHIQSTQAGDTVVYQCIYNM